ncbi:serine hydrolase [Streptomonospora wellingtoniae]|uniref:Serine hydrolase n=1 Tax=Streptomonospora wellingtoniae TaxID=3075544 RepID=A0ABU2KXR1_9ACTN|nr:serine hydrolase [Streptomonospora sp. DSM 45055]MDT0304082.1 serine hydrolase [Streptomonospora sp. DSM 45055]
MRRRPTRWALPPLLRRPPPPAAARGTAGVPVPRRLLGVLAAVLSAAALAVAVATGPAEPPGAGGAADPPSPAGSGAPIETAAALTPRERDRIAGLLDDHLSARPGRLALAVQERRTGAAFGYAADTEFSAASAVKLDLVVHMLLRAEERGRFLTDREKALAERMIRYSDNEAADTAYQHNGFTAGFERATRHLGLRSTRPDPGGAWGLGTTTADDRLRLLRSVFTPASPLSERSRDHVRRLMGSVAPEQAWGISAAADPAGSARLKNGWAPVRGDGGLWTVHSTGGIVRGEREYLVAVLSDGQPDYGTGVQGVESAAALAVEAMAEALA